MPCHPFGARSSYGEHHFRQPQQNALQVPEFLNMMPCSQGEHLSGAVRVDVFVQRSKNSPGSELCCSEQTGRQSSNLFSLPDSGRGELYF
jgi:hypothetical protein